MRRCILNVTDHEYDQILQLNHDALVWNTQDQTLLEGLKTILGQEVVARLSEYERCRMQKHNWLQGHVRVVQDITEEAASPVLTG